MACPRCGHVPEGAPRFCPECWLELNPTDEPVDPRVALTRRSWEQKHPDQTSAHQVWEREGSSGRSPGETDPVPVSPPASVQARPPWQALDGRLQALVIVFVAYAAYELLVIVTDILELRFVDRIEAGDTTLAEIQSYDDRRGIVAIGELLFLIPAVVVFLRWFSRAYENVLAVGGFRRWTTGWAVGAWFVPFLNLWRPKQIANDIWKAADQRSGVLPGFWWAAWILSGLLGRALLSQDLNTPDDLRVMDQRDIAASIAVIAAAVLAIRMAQLATKGLEARNV